jgi:biopolymer transport protein ExbD
MPVRFRCTHCQQLLSVSRKKAGTQTACPACGGEVRVPSLEGLTAAPVAASGIASSPPRAEAGVAEKLGLDAASPEFLVPPLTEGEPRQPSEHQDTRNVWESDLGDWEDHPAFHNAPRRSIKDEADMTSMVDVTFLLLVFFMITASFSVTKALVTQPPSAEEGASAAAAPMTMDELAEESVIVEIGADDSIRVDDVQVAGPVELGEILVQKIGNEKKTEMVIEAEYRATHGMVVSVTDAAMQAGMQRVRRVSRPEQQ